MKWKKFINWSLFDKLPVYKSVDSKVATQSYHHQIIIIVIVWKRPPWKIRGIINALLMSRSKYVSKTRWTLKVQKCQTNVIFWKTRNFYLVLKSFDSKLISTGYLCLWPKDKLNALLHHLVTFMLATLIENGWKFSNVIK